MPQLNFLQNVSYWHTANKIVGDGSLTFYPFNFGDSLSLNNLNILGRMSSSANQTHTLLLGFYSLTGNTLTLINSVSRSLSINGSGRLWISFASSDVSVTSNVTPGTWFFGLIGRTGGTNALQLVGTSNLVANNFPGGFIGGNYSVTTAALPVSISTNEVTLSGDLFEPNMLITA